MFTKSLIETLVISEEYAQPIKGGFTSRAISYSHTNRPINPSAFASMSKETVMLVDKKEFRVYYINFHDTTDAVIIWWAYIDIKDRNRDFEKLCKVHV